MITSLLFCDKCSYHVLRVGPGFFRSEKRPTRELSHQGSMENHVVMILVAPF